MAPMGHSKDITTLLLKKAVFSNLPYSPYFYKEITFPKIKPFYFFSIIKNHSKIWTKKCKELGVNVDRINHDVNWHQIYVSALQQKLSLKNGTAFTERFMQLQNCKKAVKAVDYQNGFLCTVSEEDYVNIWQLELNIPMLTFPVERAVSCIKFKPNSLLICGHFIGILTSWDLNMMSQLSCTVYNAASDIAGENSLLKCKFKMHAGPVFSSDFNEDLGLLVSGGADECIKLWCLSTGLVVKSLPNQDHWVLRVILLSDFSSFNHVIICMTTDNVCKISWPINKNRNSSPEGNSIGNITSGTSDPNSACAKYKFGDLDKSSLKSRIRLNEGNNNFFTPGLQYSSKYVGLIKQDLDEKHANLCVYDIETFELLYNIILNFKVKKLLALGNRYALLLTIGNVLYSSTLIAVDIITGETAGTHAVPHSKMTTPDGAQLVVGDIDWLDGLGGKLPELKVPTSSAETEFGESDNNERTACSLDKESQQNLNRAHSIESCKLGGEEYNQNTYQGFGTQLHHTNLSFKGCKHEDSQGKSLANSVASGDVCMGNCGTDLHYCNNNDPAIIASDDKDIPGTSFQPQSHNVNSTKETYKVKLERPGHLVLAAGVQSEPGRLFTLWWAHSQQIGKYKEE